MQKFRIEVEFSELFEQIRHLYDNQSESRNSQPVPGLLINIAGDEVASLSTTVPTSYPGQSIKSSRVQNVCGKS